MGYLGMNFFCLVNSCICLDILHHLQHILHWVYLIHGYNLKCNLLKVYCNLWIIIQWLAIRRQWQSRRMHPKSYKQFSIFLCWLRRSKLRKLWWQLQLQQWHLIPIMWMCIWLQRKLSLILLIRSVHSNRYTKQLLRTRRSLICGSKHLMLMNKQWMRWKFQWKCLKQIRNLSIQLCYWYKQYSWWYLFCHV